MKSFSLIIWIIQLGMSVAVPPAVMIWLADWLQDSLGWGNWIIWIGAVLGGIMSLDGLRSSLKVMDRLSKPEKDKKKPPVSFNEHE